MGKRAANHIWRKKHRQIKLLVLHSLNSTGTFHLYSDTSKFATGSTLYQIQNGKPKLIAYASKRLSKAARKYPITELEFCGLAINIATFSHLLKRVYFNVIVDHLSLAHIIKNKAEPATPRIKRLLELISSYSFNLFYIKGKDMILSNFLSRKKHNDSDPHEIILISFNMYSMLQKYYNIGNSAKYLVQTWYQVKSSGIKLPKVHGISKGLDPNIQLEKQIVKPLFKETPHMKQRIGQGRAGSRWKKPPINQSIAQLAETKKCQCYQKYPEKS